MAYNRVHARNLCSAAEFELFLLSLSDAIGGLSVAELKSKVKRARTLRDKNQDLFRRQTVAIRAATGSKRGNTSLANQRTEQKTKLFTETLERFEDRLARIEAAEARKAEKAKIAASKAAARSARKAPARSSKAPARRIAGKGAGGGAANQVASPSNPHSRTLRAHAVAAGKRSQAKRDRR
jgi:hypothetical protein